MFETISQLIFHSIDTDTRCTFSLNTHSSVHIGPPPPPLMTMVGSIFTLNAVVLNTHNPSYVLITN